MIQYASECDQHTSSPVAKGAKFTPYSGSRTTCPSSSQFLSQPENRLEPSPSTSSKVVASSPETSGLIIHDAIAIQIRGHPANVSTLTSHGMDFVGDIGGRMETLELAEHPWFVGAQFHIEYLNRVLEPRRPYLWFLAASGRASRRLWGIGGVCVKFPVTEIPVYFLVLQVQNYGYKIGTKQAFICLKKICRCVVCSLVVRSCISTSPNLH